MSESEWTDEQARMLGLSWVELGELAPGMLLLDAMDGSVLGFYTGRCGDLVGFARGSEIHWWDDHHVAPDFRDPGTRGHVLEQVRKAWGDALAAVVFDDGEWWLVTQGEHRPLGLDEDATEPGAMLAAMEAAP